LSAAERSIQCEEREMGSERRRELVDEPKHAVDDFPSGDTLRQFPPLSPR
jgi:hypothetical protein